MALRLSLVLCNKYPSTNNTHIRVELLLSSDQDSSTALCAYHHTGGSIVCVYVPSLGTPFLRVVGTRWNYWWFEHIVRAVARATASSYYFYSVILN